MRRKIQQHKVTYTKQRKIIKCGTIDGRSETKIACYFRLKRDGRLFVSSKFWT